MHDHGDALDFDLYDRWRVRLRDVPSTIGWGAVALFLRHLPKGSEVMRAIEPHTAWSDEAHLLANLVDLIGDLFAKDYEHIERPGAKSVKKFSSARAVTAAEHDKLLAIFSIGGDADG